MKLYTYCRSHLLHGVHRPALKELDAVAAGQLVRDGGHTASHYLALSPQGGWP